MALQLPHGFLLKEAVTHGSYPNMNGCSHFLTKLLLNTLQLDCSEPNLKIKRSVTQTIANVSVTTYNY